MRISLDAFFRLRAYRRIILSLCFIWSFQGAIAQNGTYGISTPSAIGKFLNDSLPNLTPSLTSTSVDTWTVENAFPNIDFVDPVDMRHYPGTNKFLIAGKNGQLWTFENDPNVSTRTLFLDITAQVRINGDCGVLGVIFHPEFGQAGSPNRGYFYVYYRYTVDKSRNDHLAYFRLSRFTVPDSQSVADPNSEYVLIQQYDRHDWHNGGSMFFHPQEGFLYLILGDEGGSNDAFDSAQKIDASFFSGLLRIDVDKDSTRSHPIRRQPLSPGVPPTGWPGSYSQGYFIPNDNPWVNTDSSTLEEFWAIGFRSPFRMAYDEPTGDIWVGDVGQGLREEVSIVKKGDNTQWPYYEGFNRKGNQPIPSPIIGNEKPPLFEYRRTDGSSVIGGLVYRGTKWASTLGGKYIFSDNVVQNIWTVDYYNTGSTDKEIIATIPFETDVWKDGVSHIYMDSVGEVYILQLAGHNRSGGRIYKLAPESESVTPIVAPALLSETGAFTDLASLTPAAGVVPFEPNLTFWSDSSLKKRWVALPNDGTHDEPGEQIQFSENGEWTFPNGTVFIKHFDFPIDETTPGVTQKIETRFTVKGDDGQFYFLTYRWREDESEADLVSGAQDRTLTIQTASGTKNQVWHYPSNTECITCHNSASKQVLGANTRQLNGDLLYPSSGTTANQLATMNHLNWFYSSLNEADLPNYITVSPIQDTQLPLEDRALSYLDVNCGYCHRPEGLQTPFDLRLTTPLANQGIIDVDPGNNLGIAGAKLILPGDTSKSVIYQRLNSLHESVMMPPLAKNRLDKEGRDLIAAWINSMVTDTIAPSVPTGLVANDIQQTQVSLIWNASTDNIQVAGYQVFQDGNTQPIDTVDTLGIVINGLAPDSIYFFAVAAFDTSGNVSNQSNSIQVQTLPDDPCEGTQDVIIDPAGPFAEDAGIQSLSASPLGGTWFGAADSNGNFDPSIGQGTYEVIYTYDFGAGCSKADTIDITVGAPTDPCYNTAEVVIDPAGPFAEDAGAQILTATPLRGVWSGAADSNGNFDPSIGQGTYELIYTYDFGNGCSKADTIDIIVGAPTDPCYNTVDVVIDPAGPFAEDAGAQSLTASPIGGTWSGVADSNGNFDPSIGQGTYEVIYTYDFGNGCLKADTIDIIVGAPTDPCYNTVDVVIDPAGPFAEDAGFQSLSASPIGGTWSGAADSNGNFDPSIGQGTYEVIYSYDFGNGCSKADTIDIIVGASTDPCYNTADVVIDPAGPFAEDAGVQSLSASPIGGTWSGAADSNGNFDPSIGQGTYELIYTYDFGNGCTKADTIDIIVGASTDPCYNTADVVIDPAGPFAEDAGFQSLSASPIGGTWSGAADSNGNFDPSIGQGTYEVIYSYDFGNGCSKADTIDIIVGASTDPCYNTADVVIDPAGPFAEDAGVQSLSASPIGGTWSGAADSNGNFDPSIGQGTYELIYTYDFGNGCSKADTIDITVDPPVDPCYNTADVVIDPAGPFAEDAGVQSLSVTPLGGTWSGAADSNGNFDPSIGQGTHEVIYTYDFGNGCTKADTVDIIVDAPTDPCYNTADVVIDPVGPFAEDAGIQSISATPIGGTWSGAADSNGSFDPSIGQGTHEVIYTYDFGNGCSKADTIDITVDPPVDPCYNTADVVIDPAGPFAEDAGVQSLSASPIGGTWSGAADSNGNFDPSIGQGTYELIYTYDFGNGCTKADTIDIIVGAPADPCYNAADVVIDPAGPFAEDAGIQSLTATPLGGVWSGAADSNGNFDPSIGQGTHEVIYTYDFGNGCSKADTIDITVDPPVDPCYNTADVVIDPAGPFAEDAGVQSLTATPLGGVWSGAANSNGNFDPSIGQGTHEVIYTYDFGNGCIKADTIDVTVDPPVDPCYNTADVAIDPAGPFAEDAGVQTLTSSPLGGTWSGAADSNGNFDPSIGQGTYEVIYTYDFGNGCSKADTIDITVDPPVDPCYNTADVVIDPVGPFAEDAGIQSISATPIGGTWSGAVDSNGNFDPSIGQGTHEVIYTYDFGNGCIKADTIDIIVGAPTDPCYNTADVVIDPAGPFTEDAGAQSLSATPLGGTWSGTADSNGNFDPSIGQGTHEVIYTYDFGNGCIKADTIDIIVGAPTDPCYNTADVVIDPAGPFAEDAGVQSLSATPIGGTWSGAADSNGNFDPNIGQGTHEVIYTYDFGNGCIKADTIDVTVDPPVDPCYNTADVVIDPAGPFAEDAGIQSLTATPLGGVWSGAADSNGNFDPSIGQGTYEVIYTYDFGNGCSKADTIDIIVDAPTDPCYNTADVVIDPVGPFAEDAGIQSISATPIGGTWSGAADSNGSFDPSIGQGTHEVIYTYDFGNGCTKADTIDVTVDPPVDPCYNTVDVVIDPAGPFAEDAGVQSLSVTPLGGTWSGAADSNGNFDPSIGQGTHEVIYTYDFGNGCTKADTIDVTVDPPVDPCYNTADVVIDPAGPFAEDAGVQSLSATPIGGTWSGTADSNGNFDPSIGQGTYEVIYTYDFGNGCIKADTIDIIVGAPTDLCYNTADVVIDPAGPFAEDAGSQSLTASPLGGTWSGAADSNGNFDPSIGQGTYEVIYTYGFGNGCVKADTIDILVTPGACTPFNLALNQSTEQSSTRGNGVSSIAVDGDTEGTGNNWGANPKITHTQSEVEPWWQVDLGQEADIEQINIYNRTSCCLNRLKDFYILVSSDPFGNSSLTDLLNSPNVQSTFFAGQAGASATISFVVTGQYVRLQYTSTDQPLHIAEVEVIGCPAGQGDPCAGNPDVSINPAGPFADDSGIQSLSANPSGGTWSGDVDSNGNFDPSVGAGTYDAIYTVDFGGGCFDADTTQIVVTSTIDPCEGTGAVTIVSAGPFAEDAGIQSLSASPSGGSWSGTADSNGNFDPSIGQGTHEVIYTYDFGNGCVKADTIDIIVNPPVDPCFNTADVLITPAGPFQVDAGTQSLSASPLGGSWSGMANSSGQFDPSVGEGTYEVIYTYDFGNGCIKADSIDIVVTASTGGGECTTPTNMALNQSASQSSTYGDGVAAIAVDGNLNGGGSPWGTGASITHTERTSQPWWQVDLGEEADIEQVNIYNRTSCCTGRLKDFHILVSSQPFGSATLSQLLSSSAVQSTFISGQIGAIGNLSVEATGRYVRIQLSSTNNVLHMAEVEVMACPAGQGGGGDPCAGTPDVSIDSAGPFAEDAGIQSLSASPSGGTWSGAIAANGNFDPSVGPGSYQVTYTVDFGNGCVKTSTSDIVVTASSGGGECTTPINLALNQSASQSSTYGDGDAAIAVNGNLDGTGGPWGPSATITHTQNQNQAWWQVDLGQQADIEKLVIYNRTDCCINRLRDFYVLVSDQPFGSASLTDLLNSPLVQSTFHSGNPGTSGDVDIVATGRYVRIQQSSGTRPLHMAEVEVMGCSTGNNASRFSAANTEFFEEEETLNLVELYLIPNPTDRNNGIKATLLLPESGEFVMELFNVEGRKVKEIRQETMNREITVPIELSNFPSGMYFIRAKGKDWDISKRFVIE